MHNARERTAECCPQDVLPMHIKCLLPDMCKELQNLFCQHENNLTKRRRIIELAEPKCRLKRFIPKCACHFKKPVEIIRLYKETFPHLRTTQLSYPGVRRLLLFKKDAAKSPTYPKERLQQINRLIRYSLLSMYSRLQNIQPPEKRIPIHQWDKAEWKKHTKYLAKLAKHKLPPKVSKMPVKRKPLKQMMKILIKLAKPKNRIELEKEDWKLTPEIKNYQITQRVKDLAKHKEFNTDALPLELPIKVSPGALHYKPSPRINEMSTPPEKRAGESDLKENPFSISPNALKAKARPRILELAEPREFENTHIRENPGAISPTALTYKASPRILELAKPKGS